MAFGKGGLAAQVAGAKIKPKPKGDLGAPADFGGGPPPARPPRTAQPAPDLDEADDLDPDQDADNDSSPTITPEAVSYRTADQQCNSCEYMGEGGDCAVLKMQVQENDGCNAHSPRQEAPIETRGRLRGAYPPPSGGEEMGVSG